MEQLREVGIAVFGAFSLHGGINDDKRDLKHHQVSEQRRHTECVGNSSLFSGKIRGTMLWKGC
jgi:hypothetical protein